MNQFTLLVVVLVAFCYFGGKYCPLVLKKNKEILLGVAGGLVLCSFFGLRLEGADLSGSGVVTLAGSVEDGGGGGAGDYDCCRFKYEMEKEGMDWNLSRPERCKVDISCPN